MENKEQIKKQILEAFQFRHATKKFDPNKKISDADFDFLLETARLSPSSIGLEAWKFVVIENEDLKKRLKEVSWGAQGQLLTASHYVAIFARKMVDTKYDSDYIVNHLKTIKGIPEDLIPKVHARYKAFQEDDQHLLDNERTMFDWASKQTYIALANMMTAAAQIGIDSCPIEGYSYDAVHQIFKEEGLLEDDHFDISVMVAFGYREVEPRPKTRKPKAEVIQWVK